MAKEYAKGFYGSRAWKNCRAAYRAYRGGLCERCLAKGLYNAGVIVHHKTYIDPENVTDPQILLDWNNLELLCRACHDAEHEVQMHRHTYQQKHRFGANARRWTVDSDGNIAPISGK